MITNKFKAAKGVLTGLALALGLCGLATQAQAAATIVIQNNDAPGEGFNDTTPVAPVGGNSGTTLGAQRLIAFQHAADIWGATLTSTVPILISANFDPLTCDSTGAVLGSAGATYVFRDFPGAAKTGTWYSAALANKLTGEDNAEGEPQIQATFNVNLGQPGCLDGAFFYLGIDNNHGDSVDLVAVLLHEFGHGLGFQTFTSSSSGSFFQSKPSVYDHFLLDPVTGKTWNGMTTAQRKASAISGQLTWAGANVTAGVPSVLRMGAPKLTISGPRAGTAAGDYLVGEASFGAPVTATPLSGQLMQVIDQPDKTGLACTALTGRNATVVRGNVALIDRGTCAFTDKVKNAQNAGAIAVLIADNVDDAPPPGLGGTDASITIPALRITQADGAAIKLRLSKKVATTSGVIATLVLAGTQYAGADTLGRMLMYAPNPVESGSSVSHFTTVAFPNLLMEPAINGDLLHAVLVPSDLTFKLLQDIGW